MVVFVVFTERHWVPACAGTTFFFEDLIMPFIHIELFEGRTQEQKKELAQAITRETARVLACPEESVDIIYTDLKRENWATGGRFWSER